MTREALGTICERFQVSLASAGFGSAGSPGFPPAFPAAAGASAIAVDTDPSARSSRSRPCCAMAPSPFLLQPPRPASTPTIQTDSFVARIEPPGGVELPTRDAAPGFALHRGGLSQTPD